MTRPLIELYQLVLEKQVYLLEVIKKSEGICITISRLFYLDELITKEECIVLRNHFKNYCKSRNIFQKIYFGMHLIKFHPSLFVWNLNEKGARQRIKFIKHIMKKV